MGDHGRTRTDARGRIAAASASSGSTDRMDSNDPDPHLLRPSGLLQFPRRRRHRRRLGPRKTEYERNTHKAAGMLKALDP